RDDLFQSSADELTSLGLSILQLQERRRTRLFVRRDIYHRFMSCMVYTPRDIINTDLIEAVEKILQKAFNALESSYSLFINESIVGRIHYVMRTDAKKALHYDVQEIENKIIEVCRSWADDLRENLIEYYGEEKGNQLANKYRYAFPA